MTLFKSHRPKPLPPVRSASRPSGGAAAAPPKQEVAPAAGAKPKELGGPQGPEPTRYGDWERKGICYDF